MPCKRRICPSYAPLWAYDWRIVLLENLIAYAGKAVLYTLTPPGADVLPWDRSRCSHAAGVVCSGERGCVIESEARAQGNETCQKRASRLYETVQAAIKREVGLRANVLTIAKEAQKRGAVHFHYALGVESGAELRAAKAFRRHLERLSKNPRYSFGHVNGKFVRPRGSGLLVELLPRRARSQGEADRGSAQRGATAHAALRLAPANERHQDNDAEQAPATACVGLPRTWTRDAHLVE
jgi:hypothetical protein